MRDIKYIVVHCSATQAGKAFTAKDIDRWHKERGWKGIGYHYVVNIDGSEETGRPEEQIGAHVKDYNKSSIGVCYIGGLNRMNKPEDTRTPQQKTALLALLKRLRRKYPKAKIVGHRDLSKDLNGNGTIESFEWSKACPSYNASLEYKNL
ncbi:N-acetylmuramoyl-L-alanine amidase [Formosa agariphila KMM 3901]|uniref:N-acetylmuramoyl-L-alanine amidase n=1 Tax=Formosa agariphila (strain DSM 15362 / KCTC 12365 / LMG 23005 / KMM 3901 / M-2Alg 35-1) TaxID=1347342 RepID=T2KP92_FORAG|nr:N-acetylmuramoyl-L-alanine amidase [Formosa agariphila]CDF80575.1 N-acetylmuramoyl-L-alanine amidase [Formosa agariphila KMM 3901]